MPEKLQGSKAKVHLGRGDGLYGIKIELCGIGLSDRTVAQLLRQPSPLAVINTR